MAFTSSLYFSSIQKSLDEDFSLLDKSFRCNGSTLSCCAEIQVFASLAPIKRRSPLSSELFSAFDGKVIRKIRKPRVPAPILRCLTGWVLESRQQTVKSVDSFLRMLRKRLSVDFDSIYGRGKRFSLSSAMRLFLPIESKFFSSSKPRVVSAERFFSLMTKNETAEVCMMMFGKLRL